MIFVMLEMFAYWIALGTAVAILMWSALNFARLCEYIGIIVTRVYEWILNKITRKTS